MNTPPLRVNADMCCLEEAPWTAYRGVCTLPKHHETHCRFEALEFIEVYRVAPNYGRELA